MSTTDGVRSGRSARKAAVEGKASLSEASLVEQPRSEASRRMVRRLKVGAADMGQAARGAALLTGTRVDRGGRIDGDAKMALAAGVVLAYARPFTRRDGGGALNTDTWAPADPAQARLHKALIESRNKQYGSGGRTVARGRSRDGAPVTFTPGIPARSWPRVKELAEAQGRRMRALASRLEDEFHAPSFPRGAPHRGVAFAPELEAARLPCVLPGKQDTRDSVSPQQLNCVSNLGV